MRTVAIMVGGDWADAGVYHVQVPDDTDMQSLNDEYTVWRRESGEPYKNFEKWMLSTGKAKESDIEQYWED